MKISETFVPDEAYAEKGPSHDRGSRHEDEATRWQQSTAQIYNRGSHHEEWDEQHSSNTLTKDDEPTHRQQRDGSGVREITPEQMLVVINFILQLLSAVIGLLNSNPRPLYSLILVSLSFASFVLWIIELVHRGKRETVTWKWRGKLIPMLYSSSTNKSFLRGVDIVGLPSALFTFIITVVNFDLLVRHANTQIQITLWPIVAASFLLCSKFWADRTNKDAPNLVQLHSISIDSTGSAEYQKSFTILQVINAYIHRGCVWCSLVCKNLWCSQITIEQVFAIVNFILEIPSALLDQLSSEPKPQYALILMLLSLCSSILSIFEVWYKGKTERVTWSWKWISGKVLRLYPNKLFFSFWDKVGLVSAMVQLILTTVNYVLVVQHIGQVPICVFPIIFGLVRSFPKISDSQNKTKGEENVDEEGEVTLINQRQTVSEVMFPKTESKDKKCTLIRNQSWRVNEEEVPKAEGSVVQYDKTTHPNLRQRARKVSVPKEIEEPSWVNGAKRCLDKLEVMKKSLNELCERACRLMNRNEDALVLKKYSTIEDIERIKRSLTTAGEVREDLNQEIIQRIEHLKTNCLVLGEFFKQLKLANWVGKALDETQYEIEFDERTLLELKKYPVDDIWEKISGLENVCWDLRKMGQDLEQVNWVEKALDETQNEIELEEKTFLKIKRENENMLEVKLNKPQKYSTMEGSNRSSLAEDSLSVLNKKTNWVAPANTSDEIKKTKHSLADIKTKVLALNEMITSLKKALDPPQICPDRHLSQTELQIIILY